MKIIVVIIIFILLIAIAYLTRFRTKNVFQGLIGNAWFPIQAHHELNIKGCHAWFFNNDSSRVILYCHGNYGNMSYYPHIPLLAKRLGISLMMFDYRGFGESKGIPSTSTIKEDGLNIYNWLKSYYKENNIIVWGESLGGSIATWIAANNKPSSLILVSTFSSIHDVIRIHGKESYLLKAVIAFADLIYDSLPICQWLPKVTCNICLIHSQEDTYIPFECALINKRSTTKIKEFIAIRGDHTTPEMSDQDLIKLQQFLELGEKHISYEEIMKDLLLVREYSPICRM